MTEIHTARDAKIWTTKSLIPSPSSFDGTLAELATNFIIPNLPAAGTVEAFNRALAEYVREPDALYLVRYVGEMERRKDYSTMQGTRLRATDNAPAWWVHASLFQDCRVADGAMASVIASIPCHMLDVPRTTPPEANEAGWHCAHILNVNDGDTDQIRWTRKDVIARFVRSVHPANYFLLPKTNWQRWGADQRVIAYFADVYRVRYSNSWDEFLALANASDADLPRSSGEVRYSYSAEPFKSQAPSHLPPRDRSTDGAPEAATTYRATRLTFKRDVIEPLADGDTFRVVTPLGIFQMTKAEFYEVFPGVVVSASYRTAGTYNYSVLPSKAARFRLDDDNPIPDGSSE